MGSESLDIVVTALAYTELMGYTAKGLLYYFSKSKNSDIILTEENTMELITPMVYNFSRLVYRDLISRIADNDIRSVENFEKTKLYP